MYFYAQLNDNNICIGVSQLSGEIIDPKMIAIESVDTDKIWRKYENGTWSTDKYEPTSTAPIDEFTALQDTVNQLVLNALA
jgi:hypothetical protein